METETVYTIKSVKDLGANRCRESLDLLLDLYKRDLPVDVKREVVSSIGRQNDLDAVYDFVLKNAFSDDALMACVYQMFRTCLYKAKYDARFEELGKKILAHYNNEILFKMDEFFKYKHSKHKRVRNAVSKPTLLVGDSEQTLKKLPEKCIQLAFTSPPYYNAKDYCDYHSYREYLDKMKRIFAECNRVIEDGRFLIVNVSPVITKRPGREFESIRYPIHFDFHKLLEEVGFYFVDEIIWIKPEASVKNRVGGYEQTRKALNYKPNCVTESLLVYRKKCPFLLDENVADYEDYDRFDDEPIDTSNCWVIPPRSDKSHPAVFPEELCRRVLKYYSFEGDAVLDPFAGSGTLGRVASKMHRTPVMCEIDEDYVELISKGGIKYDVRK